MPKEEVQQKTVDGVEIFRDQNIICYLSKHSKVSGELIIENVDTIKLKDTPEPKLTYMFMFAKALGAVLFETKEAHGTNIIANFDDEFMKIVPRYQDDNIGLSWDLEPADNTELEKIQSLLLSSMSSALNKEKSTPEPKEDNKDENNSRVKEKAQHILQSLRRIP